MHLIMFDIDGTLVNSLGFDGDCFSKAVYEVLGLTVDEDWERYEHVTDAGILRQMIAESFHANASDEAVADIKARYVFHLQEHAAKTAITEVPGAVEFVNGLAARSDVIVSLATGGWLEPARLKLRAAGFEIDGVALATSSDHYSRTEIMKLAEQRTGVSRFSSQTYFGDGIWDLTASKKLGYNFVLVGSGFDWEPNISNYLQADSVMANIENRL